MNTPQFSIPGLMTAPTSPKSLNRLATNPDGSVRAVLYESENGGEAVAVTLVKLEPRNRYQIVLQDARGTTLIRKRTSSKHWDYIWRYDALSTPLPAGDLLVWVDALNKPRQEFSLFVKDIEVDGTQQITNFGGVENAPEYNWGSADLPVGIAALVIPFNTTFSRTPTSVLVSVMAPPGLNTVEVLTANVVGASNTNMVVALTSPTSIPGYKIGWQAVVVPATQQTPNHQNGQYLVEANVSSVVIPFRQQAPGVPTVVGTVESVSYEIVDVLQSFTISDVTVDGFTVSFASPQLVPFFFNWEMHV
jgi:hypothetical protein